MSWPHLQEIDIDMEMEDDLRRKNNRFPYIYCFVPFSKSIWVLVSIPCHKEWLKSNKSTTNQILDNYMFHHVPLHCTHLPWNILFFSTWLVSHRHSCWIIGDGNHGFMMIYASTILQLGRCSWSWLEADKAFCTFLSRKGQDPGSSWAPRWKKTLRVWNNPPTPWNDQYIEHISWNIPPRNPDSELDLFIVGGTQIEGIKKSQTIGCIPTITRNGVCELYYAQLEVYHWDYHTAGIYAAGIAFFSYN
jgi:hypothetical protein